LRCRIRSSNVWIGCATENLGYAGGINAWLYHLLRIPGWKGIWVLNPDTIPDKRALAALIERAELAGKGMVGSTILDGDRPDHVRFRGGLHWQRSVARSTAIGLGERLDSQADIAAIEAAMDCPSGASMYVTRSCIEKIGLMDESYFLFFEDLDWGVRGKVSGLGYASASIVAHKRGTTTGSARTLAAIPKLSVYLQHRNGIHFARRHFPWTLPARIVISFLYALRFLIRRAPGNFLNALQGIFAGLKGERGRPEWHRQTS
jgi:GT2 family glycosyltransferase